MSPSSLPQTTSKFPLLSKFGSPVFGVPPPSFGASCFLFFSHVFVPRDFVFPSLVKGRFPFLFVAVVLHWRRVMAFDHVQVRHVDRL